MKFIFYTSTSETSKRKTICIFNINKDIGSRDIYQIILAPLIFDIVVPRLNTML